jgi:single-stranded DNA-binding protein
MMLASVYGRLGKEPKSIDSAKTPMSVASLAAGLSDRDGNVTTHWLGLVAFGRVADVLAKHSKGDLISASGRVQMNSWTNNDGEIQNELQIVVDSIISARAARPGGKRRQTNAPARDKVEPSPSDKQDFDDEIPF